VHTAKVGGKIRSASNTLRFEVYPLLEIQPPELLLTPDMKFTLNIVGGPTRSLIGINDGSHIAIEFTSKNNTVASIDPLTREVTGNLIGDTELRYTISQRKTHVNGE
jgi:hypothetical protein